MNHPKKLILFIAFALSGCLMSLPKYVEPLPSDLDRAVITTQPEEKSFRIYAIDGHITGEYNAILVMVSPKTVAVSPGKRSIGLEYSPTKGAELRFFCLDAKKGGKYMIHLERRDTVPGYSFKAEMWIVDEATGGKVGQDMGHVAKKCE